MLTKFTSWLLICLEDDNILLKFFLESVAISFVSSTFKLIFFHSVIKVFVHELLLRDLHSFINQWYMYDFTMYEFSLQEVIPKRIC